jgi:Heavy metal associated domain 2
MTQALASRPGIEPAIERQEFSLKPCSLIRGRERWYVGGLKGNERLARAVEVALTGESGIEEVVANPLTGRILVRYSLDHVQAPVEILIRRALALDTMIELAFSHSLTPKPFLLPKRLLVAELGCSSLKFLLLGGISCPVGGILWAAGVIIVLGFAVHRSV